MKICSHNVFFQRRLCTFKKDKAKLKCLLQLSWHGLAVADSKWKDSEHHDTNNTTKKTQDCLAARILYQTRMDEHSSPKLQQLLSTVPRCLPTEGKCLKWYIFSIQTLTVLYVVLWTKYVFMRFCFYLHFSQCPNFCGIGDMLTKWPHFFPFERTHQAVRSHTLACYTFGCS